MTFVKEPYSIDICSFYKLISVLKSFNQSLFKMCKINYLKDFLKKSNYINFYKSRFWVWDEVSKAFEFSLWIKGKKIISLFWSQNYSWFFFQVRFHEARDIISSLSLFFIVNKKHSF